MLRLPDDHDCISFFIIIVLKPEVSSVDLMLTWWIAVVNMLYYWVKLLQGTYTVQSALDFSCNENGAKGIWSSYLYCIGVFPSLYFSLSMNQICMIPKTCITLLNSAVKYVSLSMKLLARSFSMQNVSFVIVWTRPIPSTIDYLKIFILVAERYIFIGTLRAC